MSPSIFPEHASPKRFIGRPNPKQSENHLKSKKFQKKYFLVLACGDMAGIMKEPQLTARHPPKPRLDYFLEQRFGVRMLVDAHRFRLSGLDPHTFSALARLG
jgi:hypothetical protein